jgi:CubicO group peptidase (beta-lactamase class C family)
MASPAGEPTAKYEATAASFVKEHRLPGAAAGVVHGDELVWSAGIGFADVAARRASTPKTLYRIASITKTFTATAIMQLRDEDKLALDDPAVAYLPELEKVSNAFGPVEALTIRRLLSHESGLQSEPPGTDFAAVRYESEPAKTLARAREIAATVAPNTQWKYSNLAFQLLGEIVGRVTGQPYGKVVQSRLLRPLKLTGTSFDPVPARLSARKATGYEPRFLSDELELAPDPGSSVFEAEGGLWSCVEDLGRWLAFQLGDGTAPGGKRLIAETTLAEMHKPRYLVDEAWTRAWAIGWFAVREDDVVWTMHSGGHYGFITNACFDPKEKVGAIVLLNGFGFATQLAMKIGSIAREAVQSAAPAIEPPEAMPEEWRPLIGLYVMKHFGGVIRLEWRDGKLTFLDDTDPAWKPTLKATEEADVFTVEPGFRESGETVRFQRGKDGRVVSVLAAVATMERLEPVAGTPG